MSSYSNSIANDQEKVAFTNTSPSEADFESSCKTFYFKTTANCHIAFDRTADTDDLLLVSGDGVVEIVTQATRVSVIGASGSGSLYIMGIR